MPSLLFPVFLSLTNNNPATTALPTIPTTLAQAVPQTWILTLPIGARGKLNNHSTYPGTHPCGTQNIGRFAYQNCRKRRRPLVEMYRTTVAVLSNLDLNDLRPLAMNEKLVSAPVFPTPICSNRHSIFRKQGTSLNGGGVSHTNVVILRQLLIMRPPNLRPLSKFILRACGIHLPFQLHDFSPQFDLLVDIF